MDAVFLVLGLMGIATTGVLAAAQTATQKAETNLHRFVPAPDSTVRFRVPSPIHDLEAQGTVINGFLELGALLTSQATVSKKLEARAQAAIPVRKLATTNSANRNADEIFRECLKVRTCPEITYTLADLRLKEVPESKEGPFAFETKGELVIAGVTNTITMPIKLTWLSPEKVKVSGTNSFKMSDFKIHPGGIWCFCLPPDEVHINFEWILEKAQAPRD